MPRALVPRARRRRSLRLARRRPRRCCSSSGSGSRLHLRRGRAVMAYSTVQRVALASGLVLAVSLLLPKAFLSRGKRQEPPPAPEGKRTPALDILAMSGILAMSRENAARGRGDYGCLQSPLTYLHNGLEKADQIVIGRGQASRFPWHHLGVGPTPPAPDLSCRSRVRHACTPARALFRWPAHTHYSQPLPLTG